MNPDAAPDICEQSELISAHAVQALTANEMASAEAHIASCPHCEPEIESLRRTIDWFVVWPTDTLRPAGSLQTRLALRIADEIGAEPVVPPARQWAEPEWQQITPGIECQPLAADTERRRVSMLVRLAPGASYPPHTDAGVEELHLLGGELWIDERKLVPGDSVCGLPGAIHTRETGCTCFLVTSGREVMR